MKGRYKIQKNVVELVAMNLTVLIIKQKFKTTIKLFG